MLSYQILYREYNNKSGGVQSLVVTPSVCMHLLRLLHWSKVLLTGRATDVAASFHVVSASYMGTSDVFLS